jgi:exoribonuclease R
MIEEFMLLANMSVAKKLYSTFPDLAMLRNHPPPPPVSLDKVVKMLRAYGESFLLEHFSRVKSNS